MAKSLRSSNKKAIRTVRRKTLAKDPKWQADAEQERLDVMARILAAPKPSQVARDQCAMDTESPEEGATQNEAKCAPAAAVASMDVEGATAADGDALSGSQGPITKKKMMKNRRQRQLKAEASWKSGTVSGFHVKKRKLKRRRY